MTGIVGVAIAGAPVLPPAGVPRVRALASPALAALPVVAALFDAECLPDDAFACVASFWLGPRGYDAAPAPRPRLAMPSIELA